MTDGVRFDQVSLEDLGPLLAFVDRFCAEGRVAEEAAFAVRLAVEEAFTNIVRHGYTDRPGPVRVDLEISGDSVVATLVDEASHFDPAQAPAPDLDAQLEDRQQGGLGWHLIHQLMDEVRHRPVAGQGNELTLVKRLDGASDPKENS